MSFEVIMLILVGLVLLSLYPGALIRGSSSLAIKMGIAPLVVGLTIVAFGTSTPELVRRNDKVYIIESLN